MHIAKFIAGRRLRPPYEQCIYDETTGHSHVKILNSGSLIQLVTAELLANADPHFLKGWKTVEYEPAYATFWMVRTGWWQLPIILAWYISSLCSWGERKAEDKVQ